MRTISRVIVLVLAFAPVAHAAGRPSGYRIAKSHAQALLAGAPGHGGVGADRRRATGLESGEEGSVVSHWPA